MRTHNVLVVSFILLAALSSAAQLPGTAPTPATDRQTPALTTALPQPQESFSGSGTVDKLIPGVIPLSLLDAIDRGLKHNLGLLLSQQQTALARAQYRRQLSALLPNISGDVNESVNKINLAAFGIPTKKRQSLQCRTRAN